MWKSRNQNLLFQVCCCYVLWIVISLVLFHRDFAFITLCGQCSLSSISLVIILCFTEILLSDWSQDRKERGKENKLLFRYLQIGSKVWQLIKHSAMPSATLSSPSLSVCAEQEEIANVFTQVLLFPSVWVLFVKLLVHTHFFLLSLTTRFWSFCHLSHYPLS